MYRNMGIKEVAMLLGKSESQVRRLCKSGKLAGARKRAGRWRVPDTADMRLMAAEAAREDMEFDGMSPDEQSQANARAGLVYLYIEYVAKRAALWRMVGDLRMGAEAMGISVGTLCWWQSQYLKHGRCGLVDTRGRKRVVEGQRISPDAFEYFASRYLTQQQLSVMRCWQATRDANNRDASGWIVPSYKVMCDIVNKDIPMPVSVLYREGRAAYYAKCNPDIFMAS